MANTSIGTAWVQIKPTTKGLRKAVESEFNGASIGTAVGKNFSAGFTGMVAGIASSLTKTITGTVSQAFSGGMERADVLMRFPKVMEMMGYSAEDANAAIGKLREGVMGLPTALSDVVSLTQRLADTAGNLDLASDWVLAISDSMLAAGASADDAQRATIQFVQALQRGKPVGNDWMTVMEVAAPTMNALARELGYASAEMGGDFYNAWQEGTLATEDLMAALVRLDKEGSSSISSFSELAKTASGGFKTTMTLMRQTVENMITSVLMGNDDLSGYIDSLVKNLSDTLPKQIEAASKVFLAIAQAVPRVLPNIVQAIVDMAPDLIKAFADVLVEVSKHLPEIAKVIWDNIPVILDGLSQALIQLFDSGEFWQTMAIIGGIMFGPKLLSTIGGLATKGFAQLFSTGIKSASSSIVTAIKSIAKPLKTAFKEIGGVLEEGVKSIGGVLKTLAKELMEIVKTVFKGLGDAIAGFIKAFADPQLIVGAGIFVVVAAAIAAAIFLIGKAIEAVAPAIKLLVNDVILPIGNFLKDTLLALIDALTTAIIRLTNDAIIPLGEFLVNSFLAYIQVMSEAIIRVTNEAIIPLMELLSGAFIKVLETVGNIITNTIGTALEGIRGIIDAVGDGFLKMGQAVRTALAGVQGILQVFADMINNIAEGLVAIVALATHQSVTYGRGYAWVTAAANGGIVEGIGTETSDSNLYALSKGEYVIRAAAAKRIGYDNLDRMNRDGTGVGNTVTNNIVIEGYNRDPQELANYVSRKIALNTKGVLA